MHLWQECKEVFEFDAAAVNPRVWRSWNAKMCIEPGLQGKRLSKYLAFSRATGDSVFNYCSAESMMQWSMFGPCIYIYE